MTVTLTATLATLSGTVDADDALDLGGWLQQTPDAVVDLSACTTLHGAALQCLLAFEPHLAAPPADPFLAPLLWHLTTRAQDAA